MMRIFGMIVAGGVWSVAVFVGTFWLTFPSDAVVDRIRYEAPRVLGPEYSVDLASVGPWWAGIAARDVKLFHAPRKSFRGADGESGPTLKAFAKDLRGRVSVLSLLTSSPYLSGSLTLTEGDLDYGVGLGRDESGRMGFRQLSLQSDGLPLVDVVSLIPSFTGEANGTLDIDVDIDAGEKGMSDANGRIDLGGSNIVLSGMELPGIGPLGMDIPISSITITGDIREGKAEIERGLIESDLLKAEIKGSLALREPIDRSTVDIEIIVSDLGEQFKAFESFMSSAKQSDGAYHYTCRGMITRLRGCQPARGSSSAGNRSSSTTRGSINNVPRVGTRPQPAVAGERSEIDEERERRRQEIRERLKQRREAREQERDDEEEDFDDEEDFEEEDFEDEPPDEEFTEDEFLDD